MAITAKRITTSSSLDGVGVADFNKIGDNGVYNIESNITEATGALSKTVGDLANSTIVTDKLSSAAVVVLRQAKDNQLNVSNVKNLSNTDKDKILDNTVYKYSPAAKTAAKSLGSGCFSKIFGNKGSSRGYRAKTNGRYSKMGDCGVKELADLIDKLTGTTDSKKAITDYGTDKDFIAGISKRSAEVGLPGTFSKLASVIEDPNARKAAGYDVLIAGVKRQDMWVVKDVANSSVGGDMKKINPDISGVIMGNYKTPEEISAINMATYTDEYVSDMNKIDPGWMYRRGEVSSENFTGATVNTYDLTRCMSEKSSVTDVDAISSLTDNNLLHAGSQMGMSDTESQINKIYDDIPNLYNPDKEVIKEYSIPDSNSSGPVFFAV